MSDTVAASIGLADSMVGSRSQICAFFHNATKLNHVLPKYEDPVVCRYDLAKFGGDIVVDIIRTHPMIIVGGILQENPFFVPPNQFLQELRERRPHGTRSPPD
jgi:hypothetical protein